MLCPFCKHPVTSVVDSRPTEDGRVKRRRACAKCGHKFNTFEAMGDPVRLVRKRSGREEEFDRETLLQGIQRACAKRQIAPEGIAEMVARIERRLVREAGPVVLSAQIGEFVLSELREVDEVAYLRYASVFKRFEGIDDFDDEIAKMRGWRRRRG